MKNFDVLDIHSKIRLLGRGEFTKNQYRMEGWGGGGGRGRIAYKGWAWTVCRFEGGALQEGGGSVF